MDDTTYQAYLLRIWRADNDGRPVWRFTLQPTGGGAPLIFGAPAELLAFLDGQAGQTRSRPPPDDPGNR